MPRRLTEKQRRVLLNALIHRDGDICRLCLESPVRDRTIDHLNGRKRDDRLANLALLCRTCNTAEGNRARRGGRLLTPQTAPFYYTIAAETLLKLKGHTAVATPPGARVTCVRVSEGENGRNGVDRRGWGSTEETANLLMEPTYRLWLFRWVRERGFVTKEDAIDAGAEHLDQTVGRASQQTVERYFRKAISSVGWLEEARGEGGQPVWGFRTGVAIDALQELLERRTRAVAPAIPELEGSAPPADPDLEGVVS